jgi:hypothetical protein
LQSTEVTVRTALRRMGFEGPVSESDEVEALSVASWLKMMRLCVVGENPGKAHGVGWVYSETQHAEVKVKVSGDLRTIFGWR